MPAINKKNAVAKPALAKKQQAASKVPKAKVISQLGVAPVKSAKTKHPYNPVKSNRGVVFIKHIPHGFYEEQLKAYFEQFGAVTRTRVARSDRSGKSKGYAFVEFRVPEVAKIAAETMDNYLMFKQVLRTAYIAPEEQKYNYFRQTVRTEKRADGTERLVTPQTMRTERAVKKMNQMPTKRQHDNRVERALYKLKKQQEAFAARNIPIDLQQVATGQAVASSSADAPAASKKLTKKEQKASNEAKRVARAARKAAAIANSSTSSGAAAADAEDESEAEVAEPAAKRAKRAAVQHNETLDKLLNETIGESADDDSADETFNGNSTSTAIWSSPSSSASELGSSAAPSTPSTPSPPPAKKPKRNAGKRKQALAPPTPSASSSDDSLAVASPLPVVKQQAAKRNKKAAAALKPAAAVTSSTLLAQGRVQKVRAQPAKAAEKKSVAVVSQAVRNPKVAKQLIEAASAGGATVKKVKGAATTALKKKTKK